MTQKKLFILVLFTIIAPTFSLVAQSINIKVMSFNIQQPHGTNWDARKDSAVAIIKQENVDIIGTQEAVNYQRNYLIDSTNGYAWYGLGRDGGDKGEGSWIFYKEGKYTIDSLNSGNFWLSDTPDKPSRFDGNYNRICTYVRLIDTATQKGFYVFNAHFPVPNLSTGRLKSMKLMAQRMAEKSLSGEPIIATGDFNSSENDAATKWMKSGSDNPIHCSDTYRDVYPEGHVSTGFGTKFDYIYCEKNANYKVLNSWVIKEPSEATDHFPIAASLSFFISENENLLPIANAGTDIHVIDSTASINEYPFWFDASLSYDPDGSIISYEWFYNDVLISSQGSSTIEFSEGSYPLFLKVTDNDGGVAFDQILVTFKWFKEEVLGINKKLNNEINIYPIPVTNTLNVRYKNNIPDQINLYSLNGIKITEASNRNQIDMSKIKSGLYIIEIKIGEQIFIEKILKQ